MACTKEQFKEKAENTLRRFGQKIEVYIFNEAKTFNIPKKEADLPADDVDIFSSSTSPENVPIEEDKHDDQITVTYKSKKIITALLDTPVEMDERKSGVEEEGQVAGDIFTLTSELVKAKLPLHKEDWVNAKIKYVEDGLTLVKKVTKLEYNSRWGNEALGVDIYLGEDVSE